VRGANGASSEFSSRRCQKSCGGKLKSRRADSNCYPAAVTSWLALILSHATKYRYTAYGSRILSRVGIDRPNAYQPVPTRLQYRCSIYSWTLVAHPPKRVKDAYLQRGVNEFSGEWA
jgi:hypothetical protein